MAPLEHVRAPLQRQGQLTERFSPSRVLLAAKGRATMLAMGDDLKDVPMDERRELEAVMTRFFALAPPNQLRAFAAMRDYLGSEIVETKVDRLLREREQSLRVLAAVAQELHLPEGAAPTPKQFDATARQIAPGWNVTRVGRAWGRWRFACEFFTGQREAESSKKFGIRRVMSGRLRSHEEYLSSVRLWLETNPRQRWQADYDGWRQEYNDQRPAGALPIASVKTICRSLGLRWPQVISVAAGDQDLVSAMKERREEVLERADRVGHGLVTSVWVRAVTGLHDTALWTKTHDGDFPAHVATFGKARVWLRTDVEAYLAGRPFPKRKENALQHRYMDRRAVTEMLGIPYRSRSNFSPAKRLPPPLGLAGNRKLLAPARRRAVEGQAERFELNGLASANAVRSLLWPGSGRRCPVNSAPDSLKSWKLSG